MTAWPDMGPPHACARCHWILDTMVDTLDDTLTGPRVTTYHHPPAWARSGIPAHDPVPVLADQLDFVAGCCDFCSAPAPGFEYDAADLMDLAVLASLGDEEHHASAGAWAACAACADLIDADDYEGLLARAVAVHGPHPPAEVSVLVRMMHQAFRLARRGGRLPAGTTPL